MGFSLKPSDRKHKDTNPEDLDFSIPKQEVIQEIEKEFSPYDYIRSVNVRGELEFQAQHDEKVIIGHRDNPILGNKHYMTNKSMKERERVIAENKKDLDADLVIQGPMYQLLYSVAKEIVEKKQKFAISCHCSPLLCHTDNYVSAIIKLANDLLKENNNKIKFKM